MPTSPQTLAATITSLHERIPAPGERETDISFAQAIVGQASKALGKAGEAVNKILADEDISEVGKARQTAKTVSLYTKPLIDDLRAAQARIKERSAVVVSAINSLPDLTADQKALGAEIRNHCKALPAGDRINLLQQAQQSGDMLTIRSLLDGPSYLTGLPPDLISDTRTTLQESLSPSEAVQRGRLNETLDVLNIVTDNLQTAVIEYESAAA